MPLDNGLFGEGIYSPREAARLLGSRARDILRWTRGSGPVEPLWQAHYKFLEDSTELSFLDLIELRVVRAFRLSGVSMQAIRYAIGLAREKFGIDRPFASTNFKLLGKEIVMSAVEHDGNYVSLSKKYPGQKLFVDIVAESLSDLEYSSDLAVRWRPGTAKNVLIDPDRQFGTPILEEFGIATSTLYREYQYGKSTKSISQSYEIPLIEVKNAIRFEVDLDRSQAVLHG